MPWPGSSTAGRLRGAETGEAVPLTGQQEAGHGHSVQLLGGGDIVAVHEVVQQVDSQMPGCRAQLAVTAQQGQDIHKEATALQEWGVGTEGGQLQLLQDRWAETGQGCHREPGGCRH